jgi:hypothetical protein
MKNLLNSKFLIVFIFVVGISTVLSAQDVTTVDALSEDISNNLDLEAVASIFGDSKDLEDFENRLNDPKAQISNLDLNGDNNVDYLRVVEVAENNTHLIAIQAVLGKDLYQDVATIEVEKDNNGATSVQVVGDVYMYGPNYIIEPIYVHPPVFFTFFWRPYYRPYHSIFYWGYYPGHFHYWHPVHVNVYRTNVHVHINRHYTFRRTNVRRSNVAVNLHVTHRRNDYGRRHPNRAYVSRTRRISHTNSVRRNTVRSQQHSIAKKRTAKANQSRVARKKTKAKPRKTNYKKRGNTNNRKQKAGKRGSKRKKRH